MLDPADAATLDARTPEHTARYDVVALVASAGGHAAIGAVLRALPPDFAVPIIVMQHLPREVTDPPRYGRVPFGVEWAQHGAVLRPGQVLVAPPRAFLDVLPDGTFAIAPCERGARDKPIDRFLHSLARSFAQRAVGVVLSGMMDDGADGARALRESGGVVIVQSEADYGEMPRAAVKSGGADLALPVEQIAPQLIDLARGAAIPRAVSELDAVDALFAGEGEARAAMRAVNWAETSLGSVRDWPDALATAVRNQMASSFPTCIFWGPDLVQIYNEAFLPLLGAKTSPAGKPARNTWSELWSSMGTRLESVLRTGKSEFAEDQLFQPDRHGYPDESYLTYSNSPLFDGEGRVRGVLLIATETTERVRASRRLEVLGDLAGIESAESALLVVERAGRVLAGAPLDVPFALLYLFDKGHSRANLAAAVGIAAGTEGAPPMVSLADEGSIWPLADVARSGRATTVNDLAARLPGLRLGPWPESPSAATILPLRRGADGPIAGCAVLGMSPRLRSDPRYEDFLRVIAQHINTAVGETEGRRSAREETERLAELDRAKVDFFSNVSHEFRTPLTLLLGPLEEMLARRQSLPADLETAVDAAARNGRRLLALVNNLLEFSQAESNRERARFEPTDLAALTNDIASAFRSAIQAAGLRFEVRCDEDLPLVAVDRQMWERIVSNLLSNALKFTFNGAISVRLRTLSLHAELTIADTGVGIPENEIPNLFKRFHRVRGTRARTAEGSGIGLWMVDDLVRRIGGQLRVRSKENAGTTFTIWVPLKAGRHRAESLEPDAAYRPTEFASEVAREVSRWGGDTRTTVAAKGPPSGVLDDVFGPPQARTPSTGVGERPAARILVADDNADMREYLSRLLTPHWTVDTAADGARAFEAALEARPDLIVADVMMPEVDGFDLLKRLRAHPDLRHTPVILLTARAGEEAAIQGLTAGADDYIAKPFSPRELLARIAAAIERARAETALRKSEAELLVRNEELERFHNVTVGRELRMIELKKEVNVLHARLGEPAADSSTSDAVEADDRAHRLLAAQRSDVADESGTRIAELEQANADIRDSRRATLSVLEDAVQARDLAERLYRELRQREVWLQGQREALGAAVDGASLETSLGALLRAANEALGEGTRSAIYLIDRDGTSLHHVVGMPPDYADAVDGFRIGPESLACGLATNTGQPVLTTDVQTDPRWEPWRWLAQRFDYRGCWSFPIHTAAGKFVGTLVIYSRGPREANERERELAELLTHTAAIILARHTESAERQKAERALRENEVRFRAFVTASSDGVYRMSADWTEIRRLDARGVSDAPETTRAWLDRVVHPDDRSVVAAAIERAVLTQSTFEIEHRAFRKDGSEEWTLTRAFPILGESGAIIEWLGATTSVGQRTVRIS